MHENESAFCQENPTATRFIVPQIRTDSCVNVNIELCMDEIYFPLLLGKTVMMPKEVK